LRQGSDIYNIESRRWSWSSDATEARLFWLSHCWLAVVVFTLLMSFGHFKWCFTSADRHPPRGFGPATARRARQRGNAADSEQIWPFSAPPVKWRGDTEDHWDCGQ